MHSESDTKMEMTHTAPTRHAHTRPDTETAHDTFSTNKGLITLREG